VSSTFDIKTFGCKVNTYDTGLLQKRLQQAGFFQNTGEKPMLHILNTCAVTQEATKEAIRHIRRLKVKNPLCTVVVTGCSAQVDGKQLDELPGVDLVVANSHKGDLENILLKYLKGDRSQKVFRSNIFRNESLGEGGGQETSHTRSFLKIQDGCNSFCSFCIIPYARGKSRSLSVGHLANKVQELVMQGVGEVVLTGVHIGDYLDEETPGGPYRLEDLIESILKKTSVARLRLTSLEPVELNERLFELFQDPRLCSHFHMSIQSAQTRVLRDMKRNYGSDEVEWALNSIYKKLPDAFVGMDVIAGFPGETVDEFQETVSRLQSLPWNRIHVFPYSERPGTRAALSPDVIAFHKRKERAKILRELSLERYNTKAVEQVGQVKKILLLKGSAAVSQGLSRDYWNVQMTHAVPENLLGREVNAKILGFDMGAREESPLFAEVLDAH
jgi:threonylcarbamoyladenosine tRNA methylthiotransferase MtaB